MLQCPICKKNLTQTHKSYECENKHHFDQSKSGYTNLFLSNSKRIHGDNDEMIYARHRFLQAGYYSFLLDKIIEIMQTLSIKTCVDLGCGEGYYTNALSKQFIDTQFIGFDLSKTALKIASKQSNGQYFCASIADTPIKDHSVDCVLCIFAPFKIEEVKRILKPNGFFILVNPLPYHLYELKQALYETVKLNPEFNLESDNMIHIEQYEVEQIIHLETSESLSDLLDMTPYRYKAKESNIQSFYQLDSLTTRCSFRCDVYKYTQ